MERKRIYKDPWCKCLVFDLRQDSRWKRNAEGENLVCVCLCVYITGVLADFTTLLKHCHFKTLVRDV